MNLLPAALLAASAAVWPLIPTPEVVRPFDPPKVAWAAGHRGVDLEGTPGQGVFATLGGTVSFAGRVAGKGVVVIDHGGRRTTYEPVSAAVRAGQTVVTGQLLGTLETTASHCQPACLHWGLIEGKGATESYRDPLSLVDDGPRRVRLLPLDD